jgi:hypothetical protein
MARRMILLNEGGEVMLSEVDAENEAQLQERLKDSPSLLPVEEFGLPGPLLVVGRETSLPSALTDPTLPSRTGDILVVEMKTGPQNSDFRAALAQATDYGADLWQMTPDVFEATVAARYFASAYCGPSYKGITSLAEAAKAAWPTMTDEDHAAFHDRFASVLASGEFNFVIVAQRFTESMMATPSFLNAISAASRYSSNLCASPAVPSQPSKRARFSNQPGRLRRPGPGINETTFLKPSPTPPTGKP